MAKKTFTSSTSSTLATGASFDDNTAVTSDDTVLFTSIGTGGITHHASSTALGGLILPVKAGYTGSWGAESTGTTAAAPVQIGGSDTNKTGILRLGESEGGNGGNGSPLFLLRNVGAGGTNCGNLHIFGYKTGSAANNYPPACFTGTNIRAWIQSGEYGFAVRPGDLCQLNSLYMTKSPSGASAATVRLGLGTTLPGGSGTNSIFLEAGKLYNRSSATAALILVGGAEAEYYVEEDCSGAHTNINGEQGKIFYDGTGAITNVTCRAGVTFTVRSGQALAGFTLNAYAGCTVDLRTGNPDKFTSAITINCIDGPGTFTLYADAGTDINLR